MTITIRNRWTNEPLYVAKGAKDVREALEEAVKAGANLAGAYLAGANLARAYLAGANLAGAYLARAYLAGANLAGAYLAGAYLAGAYLAGADLARADLADADLADADLADADLADADLARADLAGAKGFHPARVNDLLILLDQPGKIRAYKLTTRDGTGPTYPGLTYTKGEALEVANPDTNPEVQCGRGINLATLPWCLRNYREGYRIFICEFTAKDVAAIPIGDGKFRVAKCKVVKEIPAKQIQEWLS